MFKIKDIDEYTALGNSLTELNENFSILDTRTCIYDSGRSKYDELFTSIETLSSRFNSFVLTTNSLSAELKSMSDLVYNVKDFWLNPVTLCYAQTFPVLASFQEIENWLNLTFEEFHVGQIAKVQFILKSYDDTLLNNSPLENISVETLDALSSTYNITTKNIQRFIVLDNHVKSVISVISNILKKLFIKTEISTYTDLDVLINSCKIHKNVISSSILTNISYQNLLTIWSFLQQYQMFKDEYIELNSLGINTIPSNVISKFNTKNIYESSVGSFCFILKTDGWHYIPDCSRNICSNISCSDCYDSINVNSLYTGQECKVSSKYVLLECGSVVKDNTKHVFQSSQVFVLPTGAKKMKVKCWGIPGSQDHSPNAPGNPFIQGGGGGYSYGEFDVIENTPYYIAVREFGGLGIYDVVANGGGLCGVFQGSTAPTDYAFNRALIIAGGGGSAVADEDGLPSGMFLPGLPGNSTPDNSGGMPGMRGIHGAGVPNANNEQGSGGGGYRGGTYRKGGTGFISSDATNTSYLPGIGTATANTSDSDYSLIASTKGGVVIEIEYETNFILE